MLQPRNSSDWVPTGYGTCYPCRERVWREVVAVFRPGAAAGRRLIKVILADDHTVVRAGLRALLEKESDLVIVGEAVKP